MVGRHVVDAVDEDRERDVLQARQQLARCRRGTLLASAPPFVRVAARREVAGEHAPVGEVFRRKSELRRDDERLEQALLDRGLRKRWRSSGSTGRSTPNGATSVEARAAGGDDHRVGGAVELVELPADVRRCAARRNPNVTSAERLDDGLRPVEVAVLPTPGPPASVSGRGPGTSRLPPAGHDP